MKSPRFILLVLILSQLRSHADWQDEVGYNALKLRLGNAMPKGTGRILSQVEAPNGVNYAPVSGSGTVVGSGGYTGISFVLKSGDTSVTYHAGEVGNQCYAPPGWGRTGMAFGICKVDCYEVNNWISTGFLSLIEAAPQVELSDVQNHSWAAPSQSQEDDAEFNLILRYSDYAVKRDDYVCVCGVENDGSLPPSLLLASAYNAVSVGLSSGNHAHGLTLAAVDGPGRVKPELVAPLDFSSYSTALVSSATLMLKEVALPISANAANQLTLKAILMAGCTKVEFPDWARTQTRPLDITYGAGELNVDNSYTILTTPEVTAGTNLQPLNGWDLGTSNALKTYLLEIPPSKAGSQLSAIVTWDRTLTDIAGPSFNPIPQTLPNFTLKLDRKVGNIYIAVDFSDSPVDNVEHIYQKSLPSGTYRLQLSQASGTRFALAWRTTAPITSPSLSISKSGSQLQLPAANLVVGQLYRLQTSTDLLLWSTHSSFTATTDTHLLNAVNMAGGRCYFRLAW